MPVIISPESPQYKELEKWNTPKRLGGMNANGYEPYPRMLYKAFPNAKGKVLCGDNPMQYYTDKEVLDAEAFTRRCQITALDAQDEANKKNLGWRNTPKEALDYYEAEQREIGQAAAERAYTDQRMSEKARDEAKAADAATHAHVAEVPAQKIAPHGKRV